MALVKGGGNMSRVLANHLTKFKKASKVDVGFMKNATYPDGTQVAAVAFFNEFGTASIRPRPFFRNMIAKESKAWGGQLAAVLRSTQGDAEKSLTMMGMKIKGDLQESIRNTNDPANAQSTVDRKGFNKPLVDTGHMLSSVDYDVK